MPLELVERDAPLQLLRARLQAATTQGHVALVAGEAGIGKTSLLRALAAGHSPVWWGACDALGTPHPLAPLLDIARDAAPRFATRLDGPRPALFEAVLDELRHAATPVLVVIEDAHWADDATLDLLKFLGRRIERAHALLAISYRDDEVPASHPLRRVFGELPAAAVTRLDLPRLSPEAVAALARRAQRAAGDVHAVTRGNPFFVTELLRERDAAVPRTVQDLVLARYAKLPPSAQALVRVIALIPGRAEFDPNALVGATVDDLQACLDHGVLVADGAQLGFRHELARVAIEASLAPPVAQALHRAILAQLESLGSAAAPARLAHHAARAHDAAAVTRHAPAAAVQARARGAHREAAAHWRAALAHGSARDVAQRAAWLEDYAHACQLTDQLAEALEARSELAALLAAAGDPRREGENLARRALVHVLALHNAAADADSKRAIELLDAVPPGPERAYAYWVQAQLRMLNRDVHDSVAWARRAIALAAAHGTRETHAAALGTHGTALLFIDYDAGAAQLEREVLPLALAEGLHWVAANTTSNLGSGSGELHRFAAGARWLRETIRFAAEHEIDFFLHYATAWLALCELHLGDWDAAAAHATEAATRTGGTTSRVMALLALGRLRLRRGDPGVDEALDEALALAEATGTLQRIAPVRAARAEWALAQGDAPRAAAEAAAALPLAIAHRHAWFVDELAMWQWRAGVKAGRPTDDAAADVLASTKQDALDTPARTAATRPAPADPADAAPPTPYRLEAAGRWQEAAAAWQALGCPYERARALADGDAAAQREALNLFETLGARPAADALRRTLRDAGVKGVARGARAATRAAPFGLTRRELEVLQHLCAGLRNADIARRMSRSVRTVDHHVEAVLAKLGVASRAEAIRAAQRAGIAGDAPRA